MNRFTALVKWNGNHYSSGERVIGSKIEIRENEYWLYDDEPMEDFPFYGSSRKQWVEVRGNTIAIMEKVGKCNE